MELTAHEAWIKIRASAKLVLPEQTYRTWLGSTEAVSLSDDTLVVSAPTRFAVEWVEDKYGPLLREISERELGASFRLRFEHKGAEERLDFPEITEPYPGDPGHALASQTPNRGGLPAAAALNERYTFARFVIGGSNELAAAASDRVAAAPATTYNPLFIWGGTGLGKTHLMHAIGNTILDRLPDCRVAYVPSEQFTNEMIDAIRTGQTALFRERYRRIDVLLIDDVHFIANKEGLRRSSSTRSTRSTTPRNRSSSRATGLRRTSPGSRSASFPVSSGVSSPTSSPRTSRRAPPSCGRRPRRTGSRSTTMSSSMWRGVGGRPCGNSRGP